MPEHAKLSLRSPEPHSQPSTPMPKTPQKPRPPKSLNPPDPKFVVRNASLWRPSALAALWELPAGRAEVSRAPGFPLRCHELRVFVLLGRGGGCDLGSGSWDLGSREGFLKGFWGFFLLFATSEALPAAGLHLACISALTLRRRICLLPGIHLPRPSNGVSEKRLSPKPTSPPL